MANCLNPANWGSCVEEKIGEIGNGIIEDMAKSVAEGVTTVMQFLSTWWMDTPAPDVAADPIISIQNDLAWYTAMFAVIGFMVGLIKLLLSQDIKGSGIAIGKGIVNLVLASSVYAVAIPLLITAGDSLASWILERTNQGEPDFTQLIGNFEVLLTSPGLALLMVIFQLIASVVNYCFMLFRNVAFLVLMAFIPTLGAASSTEAGGQAWRKANGWLLALLLFKPVAAGIYSLGFRVTMQGTGTEEEGFAGALSSTLTGFLILILAALSLPALIKFIVPAAGVGAGGFSGGAAIGAAVSVAAGAAVLAGAGAAAGAAGGGGAGAGAGVASGGPTTPATATGGNGSPPTSSGNSTAPGSQQQPSKAEAVQNINNALQPQQSDEDE